MAKQVTLRVAGGPVQTTHKGKDSVVAVSPVSPHRRQIIEEAGSTFGDAKRQSSARPEASEASDVTLTVLKGTPGT